MHTTPHSDSSLQSGEESHFIPEKTCSPLFQAFQEKLDSIEEGEEKIAFGLRFMREAISQEGSPHFKEFWEARRLILPKFKENLNSAARSHLWGEYVELTLEARKLKEVLEEQSSFAMEQIELAVGSVQSDLEKFAEIVSQAPLFAFPDGIDGLLQDPEAYQALQKELTVFNALASRLQSLRKEIVKTEMRVRLKTKLFKQISILGDQIFPKRKLLIDQVGNAFEEDVKAFGSTHFQEGALPRVPYYLLKGQIKALQSMAKVLTLNSHVFQTTRLLLSDCWDKVRELEKERKKVLDEKRQEFAEAFGALQKKIEALQEGVSSMTLAQLDGALAPIEQEIKETKLSREDVKDLRRLIDQVRKPFLVEEEKKAQAWEAEQKEKARLKKEKVAQFKERVSLLLQDAKEMDLEKLNETFRSLQEEKEELSFSKIELQLIERQIRPLKEIILEKKEESLLNLSDDDREVLSNLRLVLSQKKERRQAIKEQMEGYRKLVGASGLDFEKAMMYRDLIDQEKALLEKADAGIGEIEEKIAEFDQ